MSDYIKLDKAPSLVIQYPLCEACWQEVTHDGDSFVCRHCGTTWDDAVEGQPGTLYEDWSGEKLDGEPVSHSRALHIAAKRQREWDEQSRGALALC